MFTWIRSVRGKIILVVLTTTLIALLAAGVALVIYDTQNYRQRAIEDLATQADILGHASAPALQFDDPEAARANLAMMRVRPNIAAAALYDASGKLFASYQRPDLAADVPVTSGVPGVHIDGNEIELFQPVIENQERIGVVHLRARYELGKRLLDYLAILATVLLASAVITLLVSMVLQASITGPIASITAAARQVMDRRDFSLRVERARDDEIGYLVAAFNSMLAEVQGEMAERHTAEDALRAADRRKDEFLATLAHELRNPLAPLANGLELLKLPNRTAAASEKTREMMERQLKQLVRLVDDLLDVSRISTGKLALRKELVELQAVVNQAIETVTPFLQQRRHTLEYSLPPEPVTLLADGTRLAQIFSNLLNNAAKYTEPGGRIAFNVETDGVAITARVTDSGIGIEPAMLKTIFELFAQADHSLERAQVGLGVGLTLAQRLTVLHGGTLEAYSEGLGKGSTFIVRLPLMVEAGPSTAASGAAEATGSAGGHRILVVDDNRDFAASLAILLRSLGNDVRVANDGAMGLAAAQSFLPRVAFLDIGMPKLNGYELAARLRALPALAGCVLVAISGWGQQQDRKRADDAGFDRYLVKPANKDDIIALLKALT